MYIKWIVCSVPTSLNDKFSSSQEEWNRTNSAKGFIAQAGGWNLNDDDETEACIISFWENKEALINFMTNLHDQILSKNNQDQFYTSISVDHFNSILLMEGDSSTLTETISNSKLLRIADCIVKQDKMGHFEEVQKDIWLPEMKKAKGMLGGNFSKSANNTNKYLVSTFWDSRENLNSYANNILLGLRERADVSNDLDMITSKQILLVDSWKTIIDNGNQSLTIGN